MKKVAVSPYFEVFVDEAGNVVAYNRASGEAELLELVASRPIEPVFHQPEPVELKRLDTEVHFS